MTNETEWLSAVADRIRNEDQLEKLDGISVRVDSGARIPYAFKALDFEEQETLKNHTDLLLYDQHDNGWWTPRVVIECILGEVTPQDALAFSAIAARHKHPHPYLRYGVLVGGKNLFAVSGFRTLRHGDRFDFVVSWLNEIACEAEWESFVELLSEEVARSRTVQDLFSTNLDQIPYSIVHRQLSFK